MVISGVFVGVGVNFVVVVVGGGATVVYRPCGRTLDVKV